MTLSRRDALAHLGGIAAAMTAFRDIGPDADMLRALAPHDDAPQPGAFPRKADFDIAPGWTYMNGAYTHPMPRVARDAVRAWVDRRGTVGGPTPPPRRDPRRDYADLINAKPNEIAFIPNTSTGENFVVEALGIARNDGNVVTDALHF